MNTEHTLSKVDFDNMVQTVFDGQNQSIFISNRRDNGDKFLSLDTVYNGRHYSLDTEQDTLVSTLYDDVTQYNDQCCTYSVDKDN